MKYRILYDFDCVNKKGEIQGMRGSVDINFNRPVKTEDIKNDGQLKGAIALNMEKRVNKSVLSVTITDVQTTP